MDFSLFTAFRLYRNMILGSLVDYVTISVVSKTHQYIHEQNGDISPRPIFLFSFAGVLQFNVFLSYKNLLLFQASLNLHY